MTERRADLIVVNGNVHTVDPRRPSAQAIAVREGRIVRVGSDREIRELASASTHVVNAEGRLVVPGFNDAHVHLLWGAEELIGVDLRPSRNEQDFAARLGAFAATIPSERWITGGYWDHEAWPGRVLPSHEAIDAVTPNHPVFVKRLDGHMALANVTAMRRAGITRDTPSPDGGAIVRDSEGNPSGIFKDNAMDLVTRAMPEPTLQETIAKARAALRHAASLGVTTLQDMTASATELRAYQALKASGELTARIYSIQNHGLAGPRDAGLTTGFGDEWLRIGGIKIFSDGSMGSATAAFFEAYADQPSTNGLLIHSPENLERAIFEADEAGFQVIVHAIGDRANALVLDAFARLVTARGVRDRRTRIEHAQVVRKIDRARFRELGVIASIQPSHAIDDMRWAETRIGADRCALAYNVRSFVDAGARVAFGTDWFVEPLNPMLGLYAAVTRQAPDGTPAGGWFPDERIMIEQAIENYTLGSAYAEFADDWKGTIAEGKVADFVILSRDILRVAPAEILDTRAVCTIVGGRIVYQDAAATDSEPARRDAAQPIEASHVPAR